MANSTVCQSRWKPIVEPWRAKPKTYGEAPTHWLKFSEEAVIVWGPNRRRGRLVCSDPCNGRKYWGFGQQRSKSDIAGDS